jgi:hypothetical protein
MLIIPTIPFLTRRKRTPAPPPPVTGNRIAGVAYGLSETDIDVTVLGSLSAVNDLLTAFGVRHDGSWLAPKTVSLDALPVVRFGFEEPVAGAGQWHVPDPSQWVFADGQPMEEPFSGEIG